MRINSALSLSDCLKGKQKGHRNLRREFPFGLGLCVSGSGLGLGLGESAANGLNEDFWRSGFGLYPGSGLIVTDGFDGTGMVVFMMFVVCTNPNFVSYGLSVFSGCFF